MDFLSLHGMTHQDVIEDKGTSIGTTWSSRTTHDVVGGVDKNVTTVFTGILEDRFFGKGVMRYDRDTEKLTVGAEKLLLDGYHMNVPSIDETLQEGETVYLDIHHTNNSTFGTTAHIDTKKHKSLYIVDEDVNEIGVLELEDVQKGYACNIGIEGSTYINLFSGAGTFVGEEGVAEVEKACTKEIIRRITNTEVTLFNFSDKSISYITSPIGEEYTKRTLTVPPRGERVETIGDDEFLWIAKGFNTQGWTVVDQEQFDKSTSAILGNLEGQGIRYFETVKSAGYINDDVIPSVYLVNFRKGDNLLNKDMMYSPGKLSCLTGELEDVVGMRCLDEYIEVEGGKPYTFVNVHRELAIYDEDREIIDFPPYKYEAYNVLGVEYNDIFACTLPKKAKYIRINIPQNENLDNQMYEGNLVNSICIPHLIRNINDEVVDEVAGNKFIRRCGEVTINENIDTFEYGFEEENSEGYYHIHIKGVGLGCSTEGTATAICDRFDYIENVWAEDTEGVYLLDEDTIALKISLSRFGHEEPDLDTVANIAKFFKANPFTIVYPLAAEEVVELEDMNLVLHDGHNNLVCSYDTVYPTKVTFGRYERREPVSVEEGHYCVPVAKLERGTFTDLRVYNPEYVNYVSEDKDLEGVFTTVKMYRQNGILKSVSKLSQPDERGNYEIMTIDHYDNLGSEVFMTERYKLTYDQDRDLIGQELI